MRNGLAEKLAAFHAEDGMGAENYIELFKEGNSSIAY